MRATQHPTNTRILGAPKGWDIERCRPMAVTDIEYPDGEEAVQSYWEPTAEERAEIAKGALVRITVLGRTHPPLHVGVES